MASLLKLYSMNVAKIFKVKLFKWLFWQVNAGKMHTLLLSSDTKSVICHRMALLRILYIMPLTYIFKVTNFEMWISRKRWELANNAKYYFYRGYLPSNVTNANVVLHDLDLRFQGQAFSCYALVIKNCADFPWLVRPLLWSCSCFTLYIICFYASPFHILWFCEFTIYQNTY